ncbi:MAG: hypothetical protein HQK53_06380 [Oligoflexia bacterium]|nr:hypothetical protein [Oligoflexia bacterium]
MSLFVLLKHPHPAAIWILVFIFLNLFARGVDDPNQNSRLMAMRSMVSDLSFNVDSYIHWSGDWAKTPDGHYYSNKAPGPMFVGAPIFWLIDKFNGDSSIRGLSNLDPKYGRIISIFTQVFPFAIILIVLIGQLQQRQLSTTSIHFTVLALTFGNTSSLFMSDYLGHGLNAVFILGLVCAFFARNIFLVGLTYGFALLCDYSVGLIFIPLLIILFLQNKNNFQWILFFVAGGVFPGILWIWYHTVAFGGPLSIAYAYQRPEMLDCANIPGNIGGIFFPTPRLTILYELIFGSSRGILFTQPWLLFLIAVLIFKKWRILKVFDNAQEDYEFQLLAIFAFLGLFALLFMNASFGAWHGGFTAGPRYICLMFPVFAILGGKCHQKLSSPMRIILWGLLIVSLVFRSLVYGSTIRVEYDMPIWTWYMEYMENASHDDAFQLLLFYFCLGAAAIVVYKRNNLI